MPNFFLRPSIAFCSFFSFSNLVVSVNRSTWKNPSSLTTRLSAIVIRLTVRVLSAILSNSSVVAEMYGYATNETAEQMPIPYMVATKFLQLLKNHPSKMFRADAKAQVSYDYDTGHITTFLCSVQHSLDVEVSDFRHIIESMMVLAACEYGLDGDFTKLVNPTGRFVLGGSYADCGVTGRKLACDTYGGIGRMGGGALSGKDPTKVDRSAAYMARKIAKDIVQAGYADKCEVQLAYGEK